MDEVPSLTIKHQNCITLELILIAFVSTILTWYIQFLWRRRKLYIYSRKLNGPFAFPIFGSIWKFMGNLHDMHSYLMKIYSDYPGIFRIWLGPKLIYAISDPKYHKILLPKYLKKENLYDHIVPALGYGIFTAPVDVWKRHRKIINPIFHQNILNTFVEVFSKQSENLVNHFEKFVGIGEFDAFSVMPKSSLDTICETAMGVELNVLTSDFSWLSACVERIMEVIIYRLFHWWYHADVIFNLTSISKQFYKDIEEAHIFLNNIIKKRQEVFDMTKQENIDTSQVSKDSNHKALLDYLLEINRDRKVFTENQLRDELNSILMAGTDTTASTISFAFLMLGLHKDIQEKVYEEIIEVVGPDRGVDQQDLPNFKYLERFIKETLRLFPIAPFIARDVDEDVDLGEYMIPAGTTILFGILPTHINEKYWPDPFKFDPDRFLPEEVAKRHPCAYLPFSYGPRNCIGLKYSMMALKTILATVLIKYKISTSYKSVQDIKLVTNLLLRPKDGYKMSLEFR